MESSKVSWQESPSWRWNVGSCLTPNMICIPGNACTSLCFFSLQVIPWQCFLCFSIKWTWELNWEWMRIAGVWVPLQTLNCSRTFSERNTQLWELWDLGWGLSLVWNDPQGSIPVCMHAFCQLLLLGGGVQPFKFLNIGWGSCFG